MDSGGKWYYFTPIILVALIWRDIGMQTVHALEDLNTGVTKTILFPVNAVQLGTDGGRKFFTSITTSKRRFSFSELEVFLLDNGSEYFINDAMDRNISSKVSHVKKQKNNLTLYITYYPNSKVVESYTFLESKNISLIDIKIRY